MSTITPEYFKERLAKVVNPLPGDSPEAIKYTLSVKKRYAGNTLLALYENAMPHYPPGFWKDKIESGRMKVDGKIGQINTVLREGQITAHYSDVSIEPVVSVDIDLLFDHPDFLVLSKPAPLPVHPGGRFYRNTLIHIMKLAFPDIDWKLIHRLDANTTGVLLLAKNTESAAHFARLFKDNQVLKTYLVLVTGIMEKNEVTSLGEIGIDKNEGGTRKVSYKGRPSLTTFKVISRNEAKNETLLFAIPETGRTNQIRLHLKSLGHPIVGDIGYQQNDYFGANPISYAEDTLFLHALGLEIFMNEDHRMRLFETDIPEKFRAKGYSSLPEWS